LKITDKLIKWQASTCKSSLFPVLFQIYSTTSLGKFWETNLKIYMNTEQHTSKRWKR